MGQIIKPGKKFGDPNTNSWHKDVFNNVVKGTRKNLVPYSDLQRVLMVAHGDVDAAKILIDKKFIPSNPEVMLDFYNRLCDLEEVVVGLCAVVSNQLGYDANCRSEEN